MTSLHYSFFFGYTVLAICLFNMGDDVNARDIYGRTPLHEACYNGYYIDTGFVRALVNMGADVNAIDINGRTPLMIANFEGYGEIVRILLDGPQVGGKRKTKKRKTRRRKTRKH